MGAACRRAAGAGGARAGGVAGAARARMPGRPRPREFVSRFGHSGALMALNRHFPGHFARIVHGFSAISHRGLSPGENDPGLLGETVAGARKDWGACRASISANKYS